MLTKGVQKIKLSKQFHETCVQIGECKSREEEENIVSKWMEKVKTQLANPKIKLTQLYENVISLIHLTMLGYDTSFGHINAVNLTQDNQMMTKALGYLSCAALLDSKSSLLILIINSTQRDLSSQHPTSMALALTAICHLVTPDLIPPIIGYVSQCLQHTIPFIRQKAIMCVHSFIKKDPSCVVELFPELLRLMNDPDLSIVNSVVNTFSTLLRNTLNVRQIVDTLPDISNVVSMIQQGQARTEYYHQRILAPFILVNIYNFFQRLSPHMPELGGEVAPLLTYALQNGTTECSASASVLYEAIRTCIELGLTDIPQLRGAISLFMSSEDQNMKYIGLGLLSAIPDFADEFQNIVIDCLDHPDSTIRLRTLGLLHSMANENNAQIIVVNMLKFFQRTKNERVRIELADRITSIASNYSPSPLWFAKTMEQLFALGGDNVRPEVAFAVMRLIEENCDEEMRRGIVNLYIDVAQSGRRLSDVFIIVIARVIGSYAELSDEYDLNFISLLLCDLADTYEGPRDWVLNALLQITSKLEEVPQQVSDVFENYKQSKSIIVQEICFEALSLLQFRDALMEAESTELDEELDAELTFLDDFVADAIENHGSREYVPLEERDSDLTLQTAPTLKYTYQEPVAPQVYGTDGVATPQDPSEAVPKDQNLDLTGVRSVWGENGINDVYEPQPADQYDGGYQAPVPEKPKSLFDQLKIKKGPAPTAQETQKQKTAKALFAGMKKNPAAAPAPKAAPQPVLQQPQPGPYGQPQGPYGQPQQGPPQPLQLTEEDYQRLEYVKSEISAPMPQQIQQVAEAGEVIPLYEDSQMKVAYLAINGTVLLAVMNSSPTIPMMDVNINVAGPEVLIKEVITHPHQITAIPPNEAVWVMAQFRFPQQMRGFPDFKFSANITYNRDRRAAFDLPAMNLSTFIAPMQATTPQFGQFWKQGGSELIYTVPRAGNDITIDQISAALTEQVHVFSVERIGQEEIFSGSLVSTPFRILVHIKFGPEKIDMKILTKAPALTQAIYSLFKNTIFGL
ncbi:Adaptin N terminal region family protein [Tritrichomonas foetus]|uniref:Adaptin N terminal region family protein n=1 Tax=Tritrichomonas foetus TaxID=1144522 RepID=A0A1J4J6R6_9EUKA|nr:Adaptin N terminal region family protein [Tritrichomonas foetus]|eukprot:OHS93347.1 Adaptin N terminal region family protein [Tritrichomonas foetus]